MHNLRGIARRDQGICAWWDGRETRERLVTGVGALWPWTRGKIPIPAVRAECLSLQHEDEEYGVFHVCLVCARIAWSRID